MKKKKKVFVGMSGGVDSSVAAALLKKQGIDVVGVHLKMWSDPSIPCTSKEDRYDAMRAAAHLDIPIETWDVSREYREAVVDDMIAEYRVGRTPNPDVMCNREIKFGIFLRRALAEGADYVATGHYARVQKLEAGSWKLVAARDRAKDQSYFLWTLTQEQLKHCIFPIGEYTKPEVREMARKFGLPNAEKKDSQGICFIGEIDVAEFLRERIHAERGTIFTTSGKKVGEHDGLPFYTIGQRHGIEIGGGIPYYVAAKEEETNTLIVAEGPYDEKLFSSELAARDVNWISGVPPKLPLKCMARIRYRQPLQECVIQPKAESRKLKAASLNIKFSEAQRAITPGQSVVFYQRDEMLGGGVIV